MTQGRLRLTVKEHTAGKGAGHRLRTCPAWCTQLVNQIAGLRVFIRELKWAISEGIHGLNVLLRCLCRRAGMYLSGRALARQAQHPGPDPQRHKHISQLNSNSAFSPASRVDIFILGLSIAVSAVPLTHVCFM